MADPTDSWPDLQAVQRWMQGVLLDPLGEASERPYAALPVHLQENTIARLIRPSRRLSARDRLAIYQRSYLLRLRECLARQFPALAYALGADLFAEFANDYLQAHPPRSHTLADLGQRFAAYLQDTRPDRDAATREAWPDFLIELATLEFAMVELYDALPPAETATEGDGLRLNPLMRFFEHSFPTVAYCQAARRGDQPLLPFPALTHGLLVRDGERLGLFDLPPQEHRLLLELTRASPFPAVLLETTLGRIAAQTRASWRERGVLQPSRARPAAGADAGALPAELVVHG